MVSDYENTEIFEPIEGQEESEGQAEDSEWEEVSSQSKTSAEENAKNQEAAWLTKINSWKATLEEAPKWLHDRISNKLPKSQEEIDKLVEDKIQAKLEAVEGEKKFIELKSYVNSLRLPVEKQTEIQSEVEDFIKMWISKEKALEKAIKIVWIQFDSQPIFSTMPPQWVNSWFSKEKDIKSMSSDEINAYWDKQMWK